VGESPSDARAHLLTVTPAGRRLVKRSLELVEDADGSFFGRRAGDKVGFLKMLRLLSETE
jgi:DNA-binding MarR family transcriptional regulator